MHRELQCKLDLKHGQIMYLQLVMSIYTLVEPGLHHYICHLLPNSLRKGATKEESAHTQLTSRKQKHQLLLQVMLVSICYWA